MGRRSAVLAGAAVAVTLAVAGCGGGGEPDQGNTSPSRSSSAHTPGPTTSVGPTGTPTATHIDETLTGMAVRGVEPGCVGLKAAGETYQLSGDEARALSKRAGNDQQLGRVRVAGHFAPKGAASTCMMGRIFVVVKLTKL
ncbi:MAG: hypothetical protein GEV07_00925 [Streptosporangiales bacterium]|nr:hypothetical protein [Streptosporangiales bacterium]